MIHQIVVCRVGKFIFSGLHGGIDYEEVCNIYNELIVRGYSVDVGIVEVNYKDEKKKSQRKQVEVDFVCNKGNAKYYIQSAYALENQDKINQETRGLNKITDSFKKIVVVKDCYVPWYDEKGILYMGLEDFLLNPNSLDIQAL